MCAERTSTAAAKAAFPGRTGRRSQLPASPHPEQEAEARRKEEERALRAQCRQEEEERRRQLAAEQERKISGAPLRLGSGVGAASAFWGAGIRTTVEPCAALSSQGGATPT